MLWAEGDPIIPLKVGRRFAETLGVSVDHVISDASHFLQEDAGPEIGRLIADWLTSGT
jgi:haloalkane dehalogenase